MRNIVTDIRGGDKDSFKEFFEDYYPILCVFSSKYVKNEEQCKDIAQETLLSYWEKRADFEDIYKVKQAYVDEANRESEEYFQEEVIEQETYMLVRKAIEGLPPQMRTIIKYAMEGLKNPQIASEMGIAEGTVHALKKTAYRKLREQLKEHFYLLLFI